MTAYDQSEWKALKDKRADERVRQQRPDLRLLQQAEVRAGQLTGLPEWDTYLQYLQGAIDTSCEQRDRFYEKLAQPGLPQNKVMEIRETILAINERVNAWVAAMSLPKDIMAHGEKAQELLSRMNDLDDA